MNRRSRQSQGKVRAKSGQSGCEIDVQGQSRIWFGCYLIYCVLADQCEPASFPCVFFMDDIRQRRSSTLDVGVVSVVDSAGDARSLAHERNRKLADLVLRSLEVCCFGFDEDAVEI